MRRAAADAPADDAAAARAAACGNKERSLRDEVASLTKSVNAMLRRRVEDHAYWEAEAALRQMKLDVLEEHMRARFGK